MKTPNKIPVTRKQAGQKILILLAGVSIGAAGAYYAFVMNSGVVSLLILLAYQLALTVYAWPFGAGFAEAAGWAAGADMGIIGIAIQFTLILFFCTIIPIFAILYWAYRWIRMSGETKIADH